MHEVTVSFPQWQGLKLSPLESFKETGAKEIKERGNSSSWNAGGGFCTKDWEDEKVSIKILQGGKD